MSVITQDLCRLCSNVVKIKSEEIHEIVKQIFDTFLIQSDSDISGNTVVCQRCIGMTMKCLDFKYRCVNTEQIILAYAIATEKVDFPIEDIYEDNEYSETLDSYLNLCRLCITPVKQSDCVSLDAIMNNTFTGILPEVDFKIIKNPTVCTTCREGLESYINFMKIIRQVKEEPKYQKEKCTALDEMKDFNYSLDNKYTEIYGGAIKKELDIKKEELNWNEDSYRSVSESTEGMSMLGNETTSFEIEMVPHEDGSTTGERLYRCTNCDYRSKYKFVLSRHMVVHRSFSETELFKCALCPFKTKYKYGLRKHSLIHNHTLECEMYKCKLCDFKSKYKKSLAQHMPVHKDVTEAEIFECPECPYKATRKRDLTKHSLLHKDGSEAVHEPPLCDVKTEQGVKDVATEKFKNCSFCSYKSKRSHDLKRHMLTHKDISEIQMFKCPFCAVETKRVHDLKKHITIIHRDVKLKMISCSVCEYRAESKDSFMKHLSVHKEGSEVRTKKSKKSKVISPAETYTCSLCGYTTKRKSYFNSHVSLHEEASEVKIFTCRLCPFITKYRQNLRHHASLHEDGCVAETYHCKSCPYKTLRKCNLRKHVLVHKNVPEADLFPCPSCNFKTKHKRSLVRHMSVHSETTEKGISK